MAGPRGMTRRLTATRARVEASTLRAALALPTGVRRRLAGRPVARDGQTLSTETQLMLRLMKASGQPDPDRLPMDQARSLMLQQTAAVGGNQAIGAVRDLPVKGGEGDLGGRLYTPRGVAPGPGPLLVFLHGGGFMHGDLDTHDAACRHLAERGGFRVLAVDYRRGPEHTFPAAHDDALAAYGWVVENAESLGADPRRIGIGGDSAGGTLAAVTAIEAARRGWPCVFQLLVYPAVDAAGRHERYRSPALFSEGFYLTAHYMDLANASYAPEADDRADWRLSPIDLGTDDLPAGLAPALVATAGFDPLRDEGEAWARRLADAGVDVELIRYPDQIHGFFNVVGVGHDTRAVNAELAAKTGAALRRSPAGE